MQIRVVKSKGCVLILSLVVLWVTGCPGEQEGGVGLSTAVKAYGGTYHKALYHEPMTLDPAKVRSIYDVSLVQQLFDGLVQFDSDLNVIPSLARSWTASHDGLTWTFYLRSGVTFHNGREVTAADFVYSFTRLMAPETESPRTWVFQRVRGAAAYSAGQARRIDGFQALDKHTLQVTLSKPYAPFISMLGMAQVKVVPREEVERLGDQFGRQPVGTGAFRFAQWTPGKTIALEANDDYFEGRPYLKSIQYRVFAQGNRQDVLRAFEAGEVDDARIPAADLERLMGDARFRFFRRPTLATLFLWMNAESGPLSHRKVRQAITIGINRQFISQTIRKNRFVQARGILPPGMPGYNPELEPYGFDPERARQLLAEAGYPGGHGLPPIELWSSSMSSTVVAEHKAIQNDLKQIGIRLDLHTAKNWTDFKARILGKRPGVMARMSWHADFPDPDNFLYVLFHSESSDNYAHYHNVEVDRLLEKALSESDFINRLELYRQAETIIIADMPSINLVHYPFEYLLQPYIRGVVSNALGEPYIPMKKIWLDTAHHAFSRNIQSQ